MEKETLVCPRYIGLFSFRVGIGICVRARGNILLSCLGSSRSANAFGLFGVQVRRQERYDIRFKDVGV